MHHLRRRVLRDSRPRRRARRPQHAPNHRQPTTKIREVDLDIGGDHHHPPVYDAHLRPFVTRLPDALGPERLVQRIRESRPALDRLDVPGERDRQAVLHGLYTPHTPRKTSEISPTVARARTASMIGSTSGPDGVLAASLSCANASLTFPASRVPRISATRLRCTAASAE